MILETVSASLFRRCRRRRPFLCSERAPSFLQKDEHGNRNPMLPYWILLSLVHVGIVYAWAYCMGDVLRLIRSATTPCSTIGGCTQSSSSTTGRPSRRCTGAFIAPSTPNVAAPLVTRRATKATFRRIPPWDEAPYGPDYLTAFSSHPFDAFVVQFSAQSPWFWLAIASEASGSTRVSCTTYGWSCPGWCTLACAHDRSRLAVRTIASITTRPRGRTPSRGSRAHPCVRLTIPAAGMGWHLTTC